MKQSWLIFIMMACAYGLGFSQENKTVGETTTQSDYRINFAIPDISAFKALDTEPSEILRPSNVKELAAAFSGFNNGKNFIIPSSFAIEVSPWLLFSQNQSLSKYRKDAFTRLLFHTTISIASAKNNVEDQNSSALAVGLAFSFIGKGGDIKQGDFLDAKVVDDKTNLIVERSDLFQQFLEEKNYPPFDDTDSAKMKEFESYLAGKGYVIKEKQVNAAIRQKIEAFKKANWNYNRLDVAFSWKGSTADSLIKNVKSDHFYLWLTGAKRISHWGQLLIGPSLQVHDVQSDSSYIEFALPARFYGGTNRLKAFGEAQYTYDGLLEKSRFLLTIGSEFNPYDGIWLEVYAGWQKPQEIPSTFVSNFKLKFTIPEQFKLF